MYTGRVQRVLKSYRELLCESSIYFWCFYHLCFFFTIMFALNGSITILFQFTVIWMENKHNHSHEQWIPHHDAARPGRIQQLRWSKAAFWMESDSWPISNILRFGNWSDLNVTFQIGWRDVRGEMQSRAWISLCLKAAWDRRRRPTILDMRRMQNTWVSWSSLSMNTLCKAQLFLSAAAINLFFCCSYISYTADGSFGITVSVPSVKCNM